MVVFFYLLLGVYVLGLVVSIALLLEARSECRQLRSYLPSPRDFERGVVADLVVLNYLPEEIRPSVDEYLSGSSSLEELEETMKSMSAGRIVKFESETQGENDVSW